jgi:Domain of unknown function (DUF4252)
MKKLLIFMAFIAFSQSVFAQTVSLDRFIRKHKRTAEGDKVDMTIPGFVVRFGSRFINKEDLEGVDIRKITRKIDELRIVTFEKAAKIQHADFQQLIADVKSENFEELMNVREKGGDRVNVLLREKKGFIEDILVIVNDKDGEFSLINLAGKFTMEDINKMMANVDFNNKKKDSK